MKVKKKTVVISCVGLIVVCGIAVGSIFFSGGKPKPQHKRKTSSTEMTTQEKLTTEQMESTTATEDTRLIFYDLGYLYYLPDEKIPDFKNQVRDFVKENGIQADSVHALMKFKDNRESETEPAVFYLQMDDEEHTVIRAIYDKRKETFSLERQDEKISNIEDYGGVPQGKTTESESEEISTEGLAVPNTFVKITDQEGTLAAVDNMEEVQNQTQKYLESIDEGRRNLYVTSVEKTNDGYQATLEFEVVRPDMKYILLKFDGTYHFSLVQRK